MEKKPHILERWAANYSAQGEWGYSAFPKGTSAVTRRLTANPPAVSPPILFLSGAWGLNCQPSTYWTTTLTTEPWPPQIQTYTSMRKTRIQMYDENTHTNVWKKNLIYWSGGQPITAPREHGGTVPFPREPQLGQGG